MQRNLHSLQYFFSFLVIKELDTKHTDLFRIFSCQNVVTHFQTRDQDLEEKAATEALTSLPTFAALFNSRINSLRRRRKDPRGTRRCPESCPAGVAQRPMGTRSPARQRCPEFLHSEDYTSRQAVREILRRWVGTLLANTRRVPCLCGRR